LEISWLFDSIIDTKLTEEGLERHY
jgi:hypothetical protein